MTIVKPLISILIAVYEPRMDWLRAQLESLEAQTYPNLRLYIRDDCSSRIALAEIDKLAKECIHSFPYKLEKNGENLGSNLTFQRLTEEAEGEYFAYCDQDDVWLPGKLTALQEEAERTGALLVCSDMYIIDGEGRQTADSITKIRKRHVFRSGENLAEGLVFRNFATGCTMLVKSAAAKGAVPFCPYMVHDHYIALYCAEQGTVQCLAQPLIRYRIHGGNQTNLLSGVTDKKSYGLVRITGMKKRLMWLEKNFPCGELLKRTLRECVLWLEARERNWAHCGGKRQIWKYRRFSPVTSLFELLADRIPESLFQLCVMAVKRNLV